MIDVEKLLKQFKKWAKSLMKVNPDYVTDPERLKMTDPIPKFMKNDKGWLKYNYMQG